MRSINFLLILIATCALQAAAQIAPPSLGIAGRTGEPAVEVQGIPGAWVAVPTLSEPADSAASSKTQRCWVSNGELSVLELKTGATRRFPVARGSAQFAFQANGTLSALLARESREIYSAAVGWIPIFTLPEGAEPLDLTAERNGSLTVLYRSVDRLYRARVDAATGDVLSETILDGSPARTRDRTRSDRTGPALLGANGTPIFAADSGLAEVTSMQRMAQDWMLLSTRRSMWLWQAGIEPQAVPAAAAVPPVLQLWLPDGTRDVGDTLVLPSTPIGSTTQPEYVLANTGSNDLYLSTFHLTTAAPFKLVGSPHAPWLIEKNGGRNLQGFFINFAPQAVGVAPPSSLTLNYCYAKDFDVANNLCPVAAVLARQIAITGTGLAAPASGPWLTGISPESNLVGAPAFTLFVNGGGFISGSTVLWNGTPLETTFKSATQLSAAVPGGLLIAPADTNVTVRNPPGGSANQTKPWTFHVFGSITPSIALFDQNDAPLNASQLGSNMTVRVRVKLDQAPSISLTGVLQVSFFSALSSVTSDPTIALGSSQQVGSVQLFTVPAGALTAQFGTADYATLTTGTTAGTITLAESLQYSLPVSPESYVIAAATPVVVKSSKVFTAATTVLTITGFDNTHSLSNMSFTFYTSSGAVVAPGALSVDVSQNFAKYYQANPQVGGSFQVTATFAVSGDISAISSASATLQNSVGSTTTRP